MSRAEAFAVAAETLVGTSFRLHGRDPRFGVDCVGLVACALARAGGTPVAPQAYALRNSEIAGMVACARQSGFAPATGTLWRGDLIMVRPGPAQHHLACVTARDRIVHAHISLGQVVEQALPDDWAAAAHWRLATETTES